MNRIPYLKGRICVMRKIIISLGCLCAVFLMNSCAFNRLKKDLTRIDELQSISGRVIRGEAGSGPVVVVLWALGDQKQMGSSYFVVHQDGVFDFERPGGRYYLFAFEDANRDLSYQESECAVSYENFSVIDLDGEEEFDSIELGLHSPGSVDIPADILEVSKEGRQQKFIWRENQTGQIIPLDHPDFTQESGGLGLWQPFVFYEKFGMKMSFLEPFDSEKIPVLFVHGAGGHPGSWKDLIETMDREHFQPWVLFYPSGFSLDDLGTVFGSHLRELDLNYDFNEMVVVAHSMGGLVSRSALLKYGTPVDGFTIPLYITMATPWRGHAGAAVGVRYAPVVIPSWYDMMPDSLFLENLFALNLPENTTHYLFFAYHGKSGAKFGSENTDGTVSISSQLFIPAQEAAFEMIGINASHAGILSDSYALERFNQILEAYRAESQGKLSTD